MLKFRRESLGFITMNMSRPQFSRGNKLFLPKIEYAKLAETQSFNGEKSNIKKTISGREKGSGEFEDREKVPLLNNEYNVNSFTRFSVLPPINDSVRNARRMSRVRRFSSGVFASANGPSPTSNHQLTNKHGDDNNSYKYAGFSCAVAQQRRDSTANKEHAVQSLQVVGKPYVRGKRKTRQSSQSKSNARSPRRSFSSPMPSENSESTCKGCQTLLTRERSKTEGAKLESFNRLVHTCYKNETLTGHVLRRFNSENVDLLNGNRVCGQNNNNQLPRSRKQGSTLDSKPELSANLLTTNLFPDGRRPVSRCEINLDVAEGVQKMQLVTDRETQKVNSQMQTIARPLIDHRTETDALTAQEQETLSQGTPQIQILIDSLDSAKEELPKPGGEVPYTSVREQRRRSALCRNNSKQVDDFLLVHNLRDLGLL